MRHIVLGTAGHIDHGKSALVLALTGTDPDRLKEEKARGITIDLGFAHWTEGDLTLSFVDVPGHERFVKNMLAGVGGIDSVLFVIAADESVMPQTREHFEICRLLQVPGGVIALTKADLVDDETLELAGMEVRDLVAGSFLEHAPIVPVSAKTGQGLDALRAALQSVALRTPPRKAGGGARLAIDRVFSVRGFGTVVTGTLVSGRVGADDELVLLPPGRAVKVRGVQVHGEKESGAVAGQRVALNLGGVELEDVARGETLATPGTLDSTRMFDARIEMVASARPRKHGARVRFHQGTGEVLGRVALASIRPRGPAASAEVEALPPGAEVPAGDEAYVRLRLESPAVLSRGDRFILRAYSPPITIAGGIVLDPSPDRGPIRTTAARARFARLDAEGLAPEEGTDRAAAALVAARGPAGLPVTALVTRLGVTPSDVAATVERLERSRHATRAGNVLMAPSVGEALARRMMTVLGDHHRAQPLLEGVPREEVRERVFARAGDGVFEHVLAALQAAGKVAGRDRLALASHSVSLSDEEEKARGVIENAFRSAGLKPPEPEAVAAAGGVRADAAARVVQLLVRQKILVRLDTLLFHQDALSGLREDLTALRASAPQETTRIDVAAFKERYGVSRKYAIPLLEWLDRERVTRRVGEGRVLI